MNKVKIVSLLLVCIITGCSYQPTKSYEIAYQVVGEYAKEKQKESGWRLSSIGGGYDPNEIRNIGFSLEINEFANIKKAREYLVLEIEKFIGRVNSNPSIRHLLKKYPYDIDQLDFSLSFKDPKGNSDQVAYASFTRSISYYTQTLKKDYKLNKIHSEPFTEAYKIVTGKEWKPPVPNEEQDNCP